MTGPKMGGSLVESLSDSKFQDSSNHSHFETTQGFETKHEEAYSPREFSEETKEEEEEEEEEEEGRVEIEEQEQEQEQEEEQEENEKEEGGESEEDLGRVEETEAIGRGVRGVPSATEAERAGGDADSSCEVAETYGGREEEEKDEEDDYGDGDKRVLLSINVELEDDRPSALLILREGDSPSEVAENFCREQNLPDRFIDTLVQHIVENLQHMGEDQNEGSSTSEDRHSAGDAWSESEHEVDHDKYENISKPITQNNLSETNFPSLQETRKSYDGNLSSVNHKPLSENTCHQLQREKQRRLQRFSGQMSGSPLKFSAEQAANNGNGKSSSRQSSKKNDAYMRLYVEFMRQEQRLEEEKRRLLEQYKEKMEREKPVYSKKTRKIMRMRGRAAKQFRNYGELLYQEALKKVNEKKKMIEQKQLEDEANELKGVTRKPEISKLAKKIKQGEKVWDRLCREKPKKDIQELRNEALTSTLMECTFRPRTNHCSEKFLVESQDCSLETTNRFEQLFWDAEHRRRRQAEYTQWYPEGVTFRPAINRVRQSTVYYPDGQNSEGDVFNRLLQYSSKITEKRQRLQAEVTRPIDPTTGQELFRPQTGRRPNSQRNSSSLPIGEFLYQLKFVMDNRKQSLAEKEEKKKKELANYHYASGKSEQMLERLKARSLQQIFDGLDLDKDGYVDLNIIDTNQLDNDVANDIGEIKKLEGVLDNPINFNDFVSLMDSIQKKKKKWPRFWLKNGKKHQPGENFVGFKMDQYSRHLASGKTGFGNGRKWYEIVLSERERKLARLEAMRKQKEDQELAECTFKPSIHGKSAKGTPRLTPANQAQARVARQPTVVEEEKHELHGFIFQEASPQEHDSIMSSNRASSVDLVHSLKQMMSVESAGEKHMFSKPAGGTNSNISSLLSELSES